MPLLVILDNHLVSRLIHFSRFPITKQILVEKSDNLFAANQNKNNESYKGERTETLFVNLKKEKNKNQNPIKEKNNEKFKEKDMNKIINMEIEKDNFYNYNKDKEKDNNSNNGNQKEINKNSSGAKTDCQTIPENLEINEKKFPTLFEWKEGGENVCVAGSFSNWNQWHVMKKINNKFVLTLVKNQIK